MGVPRVLTTARLDTDSRVDIGELRRSRPNTGLSRDARLEAPAVPTGDFDSALVTGRDGLPLPSRRASRGRSAARRFRAADETVPPICLSLRFFPADRE